MKKKYLAALCILVAVATGCGNSKEVNVTSEETDSNIATEQSSLYEETVTKETDDTVEEVTEDTSESQYNDISETKDTTKIPLNYTDTELTLPDGRILPIITLDKEYFTLNAGKGSEWGPDLTNEEIAARDSYDVNPADKFNDFNLTFTENGKDYYLSISDLYNKKTLDEVKNSVDTNMILLNEVDDVYVDDGNLVYATSTTDDTLQVDFEFDIDRELKIEFVDYAENIDINGMDFTMSHYLKDIKDYMGEPHVIRAYTTDDYFVTVSEDWYSALNEELLTLNYTEAENLDSLDSYRPETKYIFYLGDNLSY